MSLRIGDIAPDFTVNTTAGTLRFHEWAGDSWVFFFSHPADFTPVCTTEMGRTAQLSEEFRKRHVKPLGLSIDSVEEHLHWINDINETQNTDVDFPIVADQNFQIASLYGMIHPGESDTAPVRSVFIIDPKRKIRLMMTYPMTIGRNFDEILRVIDALQYADANTVAMPADWRPGLDVIIPLSVSPEEAAKKYPGGFKTLTPYLRMLKTV